MQTYIVYYQGDTIIKADSEGEAESRAAFDCSMVNCRAEELEQPPQATNPSQGILRTKQGLTKGQKRRVK